MDEAEMNKDCTQIPRLSAKFNLLGYASMRSVAASPGALLVTADQATKHFQGSPAYLSGPEIALFGFFGVALLIAGGWGIMKVCKEEEKLEMLHKKPDGPS